MKSILISIKPKHCANILNGLKTIEIRKRFPKEYRGWVYIYCTKDKEYAKICKYHCDENTKSLLHLGKVIARFYCDNVDMVYNYYLEEICALSCLTNDELLKYAGGTYDKLDDLYAINITKLEIFDTPKELNEFGQYGYEWFIPVEKAPQNLMYIETE